MLHSKKVIVVMPTYNARQTLEITVAGIPAGSADEVIVVNDASTDNTAEIAKNLPVTLITHEKNTGYGGSQKTGYTEALAHGADIMVMLHGDYQYEPSCIPAMLEPFFTEGADAVFGSRMHSRASALAGGMHWWRFVANIFLTKLEESVFHLHLTEYHSGYRAYSAELLRSIPFTLNSNSYVFDAEIIAQITLAGFKVSEIPIPTRYEERSLSPSFLKSVTYGIRALLLIGKYLLQRSGLVRYPLFAVTPKGSRPQSS